MKLKNFAKNSLFVKSFKLAKANPGKIGLMVLFDVLFVISFFSLQKLFVYFSQLIVPTIPSSIFIFFALSVGLNGAAIPSYLDPYVSLTALEAESSIACV